MLCTVVQKHSYYYQNKPNNTSTKLKIKLPPMNHVFSYRSWVNFTSNLFTRCRWNSLSVVCFLQMISFQSQILFDWYDYGCLCSECLLHWKGEWISFSTSFDLHNGHNLFSLGKWLNVNLLRYWGFILMIR